MEHGTTPRTGTAVGVAFIIASAVGFSVQGAFVRFAYHASATPLLIGVGRFTVAAVVLWTVLLSVRRDAISMSWSTLAILLAIGSIGYFLMALTYLVAVAYIPVALASFIGYLYPVLAGALAVRLRQDHLGPALVIGLALTLLGLGIMLMSPTVGVDGRPAWPGIACMVVNAVAVAIYVVVSDRVLPRVHTIAAMACIATGAALSNGLAGFLTGTIRLHAGWDMWRWILAIGLFSTVLASGTQLAALRRLGPTRTATLGTLEALFTLVVGWVVLGEHLRLVQIGGGLLLLAGAFVTIQGRGQRRVVPAHGLTRHQTGPAAKGTHTEGLIDE